MHVIEFHGVLMHFIVLMSEKRPARTYLYQDLSPPLSFDSLS
jgi:hypothetical protein